MKKMVLLIACFIVWSHSMTAFAEIEKIYPAAIFQFEERGSGVKGYGEKISEILYASLMGNPDLYIVDRKEISKNLEEFELTLSGMVNPTQAVQMGQLMGVKVIITGSVVELDQNILIVAKVIGTETSRVRGESVKGSMTDDLMLLTESLAKKIGDIITRYKGDLVAKEPDIKDTVLAIKNKLGNRPRPVLTIKIEEHHVGSATLDPAAETALTMLCRDTGFDVVDASASGSKPSDIMIKGEGFSEFAMRRGNIVSVKARLEIKAVDVKTQKIIAIDRQTAVELDLTEQIAGKNALNSAAVSIGERLLPKLIENR